MDPSSEIPVAGYSIATINGVACVMCLVCGLQSETYAEYQEHVQDKHYGARIEKQGSMFACSRKRGVRKNLGRKK